MTNQVDLSAQGSVCSFFVVVVNEQGNLLISNHKSSPQGGKSKLIPWGHFPPCWQSVSLTLETLQRGIQPACLDDEEMGCRQKTMSHGGRWTKLQTLALAFFLSSPSLSVRLSIPQWTPAIAQGSFHICKLLSSLSGCAEPWGLSTSKRNPGTVVPLRTHGVAAPSLCVRLFPSDQVSLAVSLASSDLTELVHCLQSEICFYTSRGRIRTHPDCGCLAPRLDSWGHRVPSKSQGLLWDRSRDVGGAASSEGLTGAGGSAFKTAHHTAVGWRPQFLTIAPLHGAAWVSSWDEVKRQKAREKPWNAHAPHPPPHCLLKNIYLFGFDGS